MRRLTVASIVEGHGEIESVPILLRRIAAEVDPSVLVVAPRPIRLSRTKFPIDRELERAVLLAKLAAGGTGAIFILADADEDCPAELGPKLLDRSRTIAARSHQVSVVIATCEFEAWFLAAAESLSGQRDLPLDLRRPTDRDPEAIRDAKGWLTERMPAGRKYSPTVDQPALTRCFDLTAARSSRSFDKCYREIASLLATF